METDDLGEEVMNQRRGPHERPSLKEGSLLSNNKESRLAEISATKCVELKVIAL